VPASPASLRDLALLGASVTDPDFSWLPQPATALERLDRAQVRDQLEAAHDNWTQAATDLTSSILGTTRAPRLYGEAIQRLRHNEQHDLGIRLAILAALPRLGRDSATTIDGLHAHNALVARGSEPGRLSKVWRPIAITHADALAAQFRDAATSSEAVATSVRRIVTPHANRRAQPAPPTPAPVLRRQAVLSRSAQR